LIEKSCSYDGDALEDEHEKLKKRRRAAALQRVDHFQSGSSDGNALEDEHEN
jgi:hypothetical protein